MRYATPLAILGVIVAAIGLSAVASHLHPGGNLPPEDQTDSTPATKTPPAKKVAATSNQQAALEINPVHATLVIDGKGTIQIDFFPAAAPKTVAHIVTLCKEGFYNGILFHRVVPDFVAQAGDPKSKGLTVSQLDGANIGSHGSGHSVPLEATLPNTQGTIALARSADLNSGDSQFYFNLQDNPSLDGKYCVFGKVTSGMNVVNSIAKGDKIDSFTVH